MRTHKFTKGAKLIREDGSEESLEGREFVVRPMTNIVRIEAARAVKRLDSTMEIEMLRAAVVSVGGAKVAGWPDFSAANDQATQCIDLAVAIVNGYANEDGTPVGDDEDGADPLTKPSGGSATT